MKILITSATVLFVLICFIPCAQSKQLISKVQNDTLKRESKFTGTVTGWLVSDKGNNYNGFSLQTSNENLMVMFPEHMGKELRQVIKMGKTVTIRGYGTKDSLGVTRINLVSATIDGNIIQVSSPFIAGTMPENEIINGGAKIRELQKNVDGKITGYILDNKTILRLTPNTSQELDKLLVVGANISYSGTKSYAGSGEDAWSTYTVIFCQIITINGKQYLTK